MSRDDFFGWKEEITISGPWHGRSFKDALECVFMKGHRDTWSSWSAWLNKWDFRVLRIGVKVFVAFLYTIAALIFICMVVYDHDSLFIAIEAVHALRLSFLIYNLAT
ncbi:hypothetical protein L1887_12325 [Cichorium endivia]|nr:hypothetical protein L1887_12325 [Cichorium endivia]